MQFSTLTKQRIPYLIGAIALMYLMKPTIMFKPNGKPRLYGVGVDEEGYKKTLYTFQFSIIITVIFLVLMIR